MNDFIRIVSYNIQSGNGMDHVHDVPRTAAAINRLNPDAVGLQEVRIYADRPGDGDIPAILSAHTGLKAHFGLAISFRLLNTASAFFPDIPPKLWRKSNCRACPEPNSAWRL